MFRRHMIAIHGSKELPVKRRRTPKSESLTIDKSKRSRNQKLIPKDGSESEESVESESEFEDDLSSDDLPLKSRQKERRKRPISDIKVFNPKRRPNNRHGPERQSLYGPEIDSLEKLFADEICGKSVFTSLLYINITRDLKPLNGEISEELAESQGLSPLRWRDLLICTICKTKFVDIVSLTDHIAHNHGSRSKAFGCLECDVEYGALYESSLVNHLVERHYFEHLKFCCLVCSRLFFDLITLIQHYKIHKGQFDILVCFICGFYSKTLDDLKEHKAYHIQVENCKPENQALCENVHAKYIQGIEANTFNLQIADFEKNEDGSVTEECQQRFMIDWSFAQYQCPLCFANNSNPFELFVHLRLKHPKEQDQTRKIYSCNTCVEKKTFSGMHYFINHAADFHYESLRFTCVVCSKLHWNFLALANHYKNVHPSFTVVFCCHCGKLFHSITSGAIHYKKIMIMLTDEEKQLKKEGKLECEKSTHICHICGKSCKNNVSK